MEDNCVFVKCKVLGQGTMYNCTANVVDLVVVGNDNTEYAHKFTVYDDDVIPLDTQTPQED